MDEILSPDDKKKKTCKQFIPEWNFTMNMFLLNFGHALNMLSNTNIFEHNES